jgi:predicted nucleic acid-binding protein
MASYVVDASVISQYLITDTYTNNATALFRQLRRGDRLYVPEFCRLECVNVVWKQVRFQSMSQADAEQLILDLMALPLRTTPVASLYTEALQIGLKHQLAVYDSVYIALAQHLNHPLITIDQAQSRAAAQEGITLKPVTDFKLTPDT